MVNILGFMAQKRSQLHVLLCRHTRWRCLQPFKNVKNTQLKGIQKQALGRIQLWLTKMSEVWVILIFFCFFYILKILHYGHTVHFYDRKIKQQYVMILKISSYSVCSLFFSWAAHKIRRVWLLSVILKETTQGLKTSSKKMDNTKGEENYSFRQNL